MPTNPKDKPGGVLGPDNNPGNARWCTDCKSHGRLECTGQRSRGRGICHGPAIRGLNRCRTHAGVRAATAQAKGEAVITAWTAMGKPAPGKGIEAGMAVLGMLQMSWLRAHAYGELLRKQVVIEGAEADEITKYGDPQASGLIGYRYGAAGKEGIVYVQNEEVRALVALESAERDRVVKYAKTAHDMGISERLTRLAESWGDVVANKVIIILDGLDLTPEQQVLVPALVTQHLSAIEVGSD